MFENTLVAITLTILALPAFAEDIRYQAKRIAPWTIHYPKALEPLPDGRLLVTEREGNVVILGGESRLVRVPLALPDLYVAGQGGLLDIALAQDFDLSGRIILTFSQGTETANHLAVATATLQNDTITGIDVVFSVSPDKDTPVHFGGRLAVLNDGTWLVSSGDGFDYREHAQRTDSQLGKILRIREDGAAPLDNPFYDTAPYIYSMGHRNPQGLAIDEDAAVIFEHEHGPDGGDEINILRPGLNYGWPVATSGRDYSGARISPFTDYAGMESPLVEWTPSVAPSAMVFYNSDLFPGLKGQLLVTTLKEQSVIAVDMSTTPARNTKLFATINQRLRDIEIDRKGAIYVLTDGENATVLRIAPL